VPSRSEVSLRRRRSRSATLVCDPLKGSHLP
jgi:hypothetical protein